MQYFKENNQSPFATAHPVLDYEADGWTGEGLGTEWVTALNLEAEQAFRRSVVVRLPAGLSDEEIDQKVREGSKKKQHCVAEKDVRQAIIDLFLCHLRWHPTTHEKPTSDALPSYRASDIWKQQVKEMHDACKQHGAQWAWEYLWRHWYREGRWPIWARAICPEVPIINSNAIVESMWSVMKRRYLRKHSRAKLEFVIDIILNQWLPNVELLVMAHRSLQQKPVWQVFI
jgi:hypothetical protein